MLDPYAYAAVGEVGTEASTDDDGPEEGELPPLSWGLVSKALCQTLGLEKDNLVVVTRAKKPRHTSLATESATEDGADRGALGSKVAGQPRMPSLDEYSHML